MKKSRFLRHITHLQHHKETDNIQQIQIRGFLSYVGKFYSLLKFHNNKVLGCLHQSMLIMCHLKQSVRQINLLHPPKYSSYNTTAEALNPDHLLFTCIRLTYNQILILLCCVIVLKAEDMLIEVTLWQQTIQRHRAENFTAFRQTGTFLASPVCSTLLKSFWICCFLLCSIDPLFFFNAMVTHWDEENMSSSIQFHTWWSLYSAAHYILRRRPVLSPYGQWKSCLFAEASLHIHLQTPFMGSWKGSL